MFVVVSIKKTRLSRKSLFGVTDINGKNLRLRLKRGNKSGYRWFPMRRVFSLAMPLVSAPSKSSSRTVAL